MGDKKVTTEYDDDTCAFTLGVLNDLRALEHMLDSDMFEETARRIGAEQELFLVDSAMRPAGLAVEVIEQARDGRLTTEIGKFNLEANLTPRSFEGPCLRLMEEELNEMIGVARDAAQTFDAGSGVGGHSTHDPAYRPYSPKSYPRPTIF